jgi:serine/threonine protein kinase
MTAPVRLAVALSDRYRIERELGQGGIATVYLAQDLKHGRRVGLKVLKPLTKRGVPQEMNFLKSDSPEVV